MTIASDLMLSALRDELNGGRKFWFSGPVPANADEPLDMVNDHTQLVEFTEGGDGVTGLTFEAPSGGAMLKTASEVWSGLVDFDGAEAAEDTLTATFYRFCADGDDGRDAGTTARIQGTIGTAGTNILMANPDLTDNDLNTQGLSYFAVTEESF